MFFEFGRIIICGVIIYGVVIRGVIACRIIDEVINMRLNRIVDWTLDGVINGTIKI